LYHFLTLPFGLGLINVNVLVLRDLVEILDLPRRSDQEIFQPAGSVAHAIELVKRRSERRLRPQAGAGTIGLEIVQQRPGAHEEVPANPMPMKITPHIQAAGHRLHVPFQHGTHTMAAGMPPPDEQFGSLLLEFMHCFEGFTRQGCLRKFEESPESSPVGDIRSGLIDAPEEELQLRADRSMLAAAPDAEKGVQKTADNDQSRKKSEPRQPSVLTVCGW
jgi:hypothetical protein